MVVAKSNVVNFCGPIVVSPYQYVQLQAGGIFDQSSVLVILGKIPWSYDLTPKLLNCMNRLI